MEGLIMGFPKPQLAQLDGVGVKPKVGVGVRLTVGVGVVFVYF